MEPMSSEEPLLGEALAITVADEQGRKRRSDATGEKGDLRHCNSRRRVARHHGVTILATSLLMHLRDNNSWCGCRCCCLKGVEATAAALAALRVAAAVEN
ncbi:hypothetical protein AHAS_Ahas19G0264900 [Arachis hypogaea]